MNAPRSPMNPSYDVEEDEKSSLCGLDTCLNFKVKNE